MMESIVNLNAARPGRCASADSRSLPLAAGVAMLALCLALASAARAADEPAPDYTAHIAPIFEKYCTGCHNDDEFEGKLSLVSFEKLTKGGKHGPAIAPGKADQSRLLLALTGKVEPKMPPEDNDPPSASDIAMIRRWIESGAKGPLTPVAEKKTLVTPRVDPLHAVREAVTAVAFAPAGDVLAVGRYGSVEILTSDDRSSLRALAGLHGRVTAVGFSSDGQKILAAGGEAGMAGEARLWDRATGSPLQTFEGHQDNIYSAIVSPDGKLLATASYDQRIKLWDIATGREVRTLAGHNDAVYDLAFRPDGKVLASASGDRTLKLWDVATGQRLDTLSQSLKELYAVAFSPDGRRVIAGGVDNRIRMWQVSPDAKENSNPIVYSRFAHEGAVVRLIYSPDGQSIVSAGEDRTVKIWDAQTLTERRALAQQADWVAAVAVSPDSKTLVVGRLDGTLAAYDLKTGRELMAAAPELASLSLRGLQNGATARLVVFGKHLVGTKEVKSTVAGLVGKVIARKSEQLELEVAVPARAARGPFELWVTGPGGASNRLPIHVDDLPQVAETEPNNTPGEATKVTLPADVWGELGAVGDFDCYSFEARKGQTLVCETTASKMQSKLRARLTLYDPHGSPVQGKEAGRSVLDPLMAYDIPADGRYTLKVADLQLAGSNKHFYRLAMGAIPYAAAVFPTSIAANREAEVEVWGFNLPKNFHVKIPPAGTGTIDVPLDGADVRQRSPLKVLVSSDAEFIESEPNDTPETASKIVTPCHVGGRLWSQAAATGAARLAKRGDEDLFRFEAKAGEAWIFESQAAQLHSPADTVIEVLHADGKPVERLLLQATRDSSITFRPIDGSAADARLTNWEEMELNELVYMNGEVVKLYRAPQGPDSGFRFYQALDGSRKSYFDTTSTTHAVDEPCYVVEPQPPGAKLAFTGLPVFSLNYVNDDESNHRVGTDSQLTFTAPKTGTYLVRVRDARGASDEQFIYRLTVRRPSPDFAIRLDGVGPIVPAGGGRSIGLSVDRLDGFDGPVKVEIDDLPPGFHVSSPVTIERGHREAKAVLYADAGAPQPDEKAGTGSRVRATALVNGREVTKDVGSLGRIRLAPKPKLLVRMEPSELVIAPGQTIPATIRVERNGNDEIVTFLVHNLPHGVIVDNIGLNGVLLPRGKTERQIFLSAAPWVPETSRTCYAETIETPLEASPPVLLHVRKPSGLARAQ